jgi:hypothetical protein
VKVIFISGPYRAKNEWGLVQNIRHAEQVALRLWLEGWAVFCPHKNTAFFGGGCDDSVWLEGDMEILRRCDAIYMLNTWTKSAGATAEHGEALRLGIPIFYEPKELE